MQFCSECGNMYYMRLSADNGGGSSDKLEFYCRNCGHEDSTITSDVICVSEYQTQSSDMKLKNMINKYTKYDPALPRANNILCPNPKCTNLTPTPVTEHIQDVLKSRDSDIIYIRYDDENMKYAWICSKCDYTWTNDNHIDNKKLN